MTQIGNVSTPDANVLTRGQPRQYNTRSQYVSGDAPSPVVHVTTIILFHNGTLAVFEAHSTMCSRGKIGKVSTFDASVWTRGGPGHGHRRSTVHRLTPAPPLFTGSQGSILHLRPIRLGRINVTAAAALDSKAGSGLAILSNLLVRTAAIDVGAGVRLDLRYYELILCVG